MVPFSTKVGNSSLNSIIEAEAQNHYIVASQQHTFSVYRDVTLLWAARSNSNSGSSRSVVSMAVSEIGNVPGFIVTVDEGANLTVSYLGTDPPVHAVRFEEQKELDYSSMEQEHRLAHSFFSLEQSLN
jgi:hypothetical protein